MMHFEITYYIGSHAFTYQCTTAHEAFDALEDLAMHDRHLSEIDPDKFLEILIDMKRGKILSHHGQSYAIRYVEGEV